MTLPQMMRGFERLRQIVSAYLQASMPYYVDVARTEWGLDEFHLPYPARYDVYDPSMAGNSDYPMIAMLANNDSRHVRNDIRSDASQEYQSTWATKIMVICRSPLAEDGSTWLLPEKEQAMRLCTDLTRVMHNALLQMPGCGRPAEVFMEETTMATDYMEPVNSNTQGVRWIAMSSTSVDFRLTEKTYALPYGTADTILNEVSKLTP